MKAQPDPAIPGRPGIVARILRRLARRLPSDELGCGPDGSTMRRWVLFRIGDFQVRLHQFIADDLYHMHDHSSHGLSWIVSGRYIEETPQGRHLRRRWSFQLVGANHIHRVFLDRGCRDEVWTVFFMTPKVRGDWGYYANGRRLPFYEYKARYPCQRLRRRSRRAARNR